MLRRGTLEVLSWYLYLVLSVSQDLLNEFLSICGVGVHLWLSSRKGSEVPESAYKASTLMLWFHIVFSWSEGTRLMFLNKVRFVLQRVCMLIWQRDSFKTICRIIIRNRSPAVENEF